MIKLISPQELNHKNKNMIKNDVLECIYNRCSVRQFIDKNLKPEEEEAILKAAMYAPTAANMQLYSIIVVKNPQTKEFLARTCNNQPWLAKCPFLLIFCADYQKLYDYYDLSKVEEKCKETNVTFIRPGEQYLILATADAMIAAQNAVIAGESLGIGSCYVGHIMDHYKLYSDTFSLPEYVFPVSILAMGYPNNPNHPPKKRQDEQFIVHKEKYTRFNLNELEECYKNFPSLPINNKFNLENKAQAHYILRHSSSTCYSDGIKSVKEALKHWK